MSEILWKRLLGRPVFPFERRGDFYLAWKHYGWDHARALIAEMRSLLRHKGVPLVVLVFPISDQVDDEYRKLDQAYVLYPQRKIREICEEYAIPMLDLTEALYREGGITLFRDYLHLNAKGNDVVTNELQNYVVDTLEHQIGEGGDTNLGTKTNSQPSLRFGARTKKTFSRAKPPFDGLGVVNTEYSPFFTYLAFLARGKIRMRYLAQRALRTPRMNDKERDFACLESCAR